MSWKLRNVDACPGKCTLLARFETSFLGPRTISPDRREAENGGRKYFASPGSHFCGLTSCRFRACRCSGQLGWYLTIFDGNFDCLQYNRSPQTTSITESPAHRTSASSSPSMLSFVVRCSSAVQAISATQSNVRHSTATQNAEVWLRIMFRLGTRVLLHCRYTGTMLMFLHQGANARHWCPNMLGSQRLRRASMNILITG